MTTEREVTIKLGIKPMPGSDRPLKDIVREAEHGSKAVAVMDKAFTALENKIKSVGRGIKGALGMGEGSGTFRLGGVQGFGATMGGIQQLNNSFRQLADVTGFLSGRISDAAKKYGPLTDAVNATTNIMHDLAAMAGSARSQAIVGMQRRQGMLREELAGINAGAQQRAAQTAAGGFNAQLGAQMFVGGDQRELIRGAVGTFEERVRSGRAAGINADVASSLHGVDVGQLNQLTRVSEEMPGLVAFQKQLVSIEQQRIEMLRNEQAVRQQMVQQNIDHLKREEDRYKEIARLERERAQSLKQQFGLMNPMEQATIKRLAAKAATGEQFTPTELRQAQRHGEFFGQQIRNQAGAMGDAAGFAQIAKNLGIDARIRENEAAAGRVQEIRMRVEQNLQIEIRQDAAEITRQIMVNLKPEQDKLIRLIAQQYAVEAERLRQQEVANRNAGLR